MRAPKSATSTDRNRGAQARQLRIIAGRWRGRRWRFVREDIRPTPDRVRETLFNWLQGSIAGARCLDLYAGSGALGLEALSRGAAFVQFVDSDAQVASALRTQLAAWGDTGAAVAHAAALDFLRGAPRAFDIVFIDPPYAAGEYAGATQALERAGWLHADSRIYLEHGRDQPPDGLPAGWHALKSGQAGAVSYHLYRRG